MKDLFEMYNVDVKTIDGTNDSKKGSNKPKKASKSNSKKDIKPQKTANEKLEEELKNFIKVEVKAFGGQVMVIEGEEINNTSLNTIQSRLVSMGYGEFAQDVIWQLVSNEDKTEAILVAGCKFYAKG